MKTITITDEGTTTFTQVISDAQSTAAIAAIGATAPALPPPAITFGQVNADQTRTCTVTATNNTGQGSTGIEVDGVIVGQSTDAELTVSITIPAEPTGIRAVVISVDGIAAASDVVTV